MPPRAAAVLSALALAACSDAILSGPDDDAAVDAAATEDLGRADRGRPREAGARDGPRDGPRLDAGARDLARLEAPLPLDLPPPSCGEWSGLTRFTCAKDGNSRGKCPGGVPTIESCANGCLRKTPPADDVCMGTSATFSCTGSYGTTKAENGDYYITTFGCWTDASGVTHGDPGDNCIPACLSKARSSGLCQSSWSGKTCEEKTNYFVADSGRFGCLQRLRVSNPANGKQVIVVALDAGPACWVEQNAQKAILDVAPPVALHLFGGSAFGWSDKKLVHVVEVDNATPLGPLP
jgi:hypothetical protein